MILEHYSALPLTELRAVSQDLRRSLYKPNGLWVSVPGEDDWPTWCRDNEFGDLTHCTHLTLADDHNVLIIDTEAELDDFHEQYSDGDSICWDVVARDCDGLIIAPYVASRRYQYLWYYGWDCASGCIWNPRSLMLVERAK